jgi:predicted nucleic acid-binding protein
MRFFDASALVKRYVWEAHTGRVRRLLAEGDVVVSRLSEVEVVSALARLARDGAITQAERDRATVALQHDLDEWHVVEVAAQVAARARLLLLRHPIRSGDAIQLASAQYLEQMLDQPLTGFIAFDARLNDAARAEGISAAR